MRHSTIIHAKPDGWRASFLAQGAFLLFTFPVLDDDQRIMIRNDTLKLAVPRSFSNGGPPAAPGRIVFSRRNAWRGKACFASAALHAMALAVVMALAGHAPEPDIVEETTFPMVFEQPAGVIPLSPEVIMEAPPAPAASLNVLSSKDAPSVPKEIPPALEPLPSPSPKPAQAPSPPKSRPPPPKSVAVTRPAPVREAVSQAAPPGPSASPATPPPALARAMPVAPAPALAPAIPVIDAAWQRAVSDWLASARNYPEEARRRGEEGRVTVRFTVDRMGRVVEAAVAVPSGFVLLDTAALALLRQAALPAFPPSMTQARVTLTTAVRYTLR